MAVVLEPELDLGLAALTAAGDDSARQAPAQPVLEPARRAAELQREVLQREPTFAVHVAKGQTREFRPRVSAETDTGETSPRLFLSTSQAPRPRAPIFPAEDRLPDGSGHASRHRGSHRSKLPRAGCPGLLWEE